MTNIVRMSIKRGMLVVLEGNDRAGKSSQALKLVESLKAQGKKAKYVSFPDRSTAIGSVINKYLLRETDLHDNAIHLLFTANRWEKFDEMLSNIKSGTTLIVDRYSYSGVAYSSSKKGADFEWCFAPEKGLLKPDCVLFLSCDIKNLETRKDFGSEVYETNVFQNSVRDAYLKMKDEHWNIVDASRSIEEIHQDILKIVTEKYEKLTDDISTL